MKIELLYLADCPSSREARDRLREALAEANVDAPITLIEIKTEADAQRWRFSGSPTIRFDGVDPFAQGEASYGIGCRVFQTPTGLRGSPTKEMLHMALSKLSK